MPTPGLSLVGFMDEPLALSHLKTSCIPANPSDAALIGEWNAARARIGNPFPNAGQPDIQPIPAPHDAYIQNLVQIDWLAPLLAGHWQRATFQLIELDPLLAFQFSVDTARSAHHCQPLQNVPDVAALLPICLPAQLPNEPVHAHQQGQSFIIKSRNLNFRIIQDGPLGPNAIGIAFGWSPPLMHVVRYNGKCFLHNGFHRAYGLRLAGCTHAPCILRDVQSVAEVGIKDDNSTFPASLFDSNHAPTLGHFSQGRAWNVTLRATTRIMHIGWSEYAMIDE